MEVLFSTSDNTPANKLKILVFLRIVSYGNELSDLLLLKQDLFLFVLDPQDPTWGRSS